MESYNQFLNESSSPGDTSTDQLPLFATYLNMVVIAMVVIIVITPAVMVIRVIWNTKELHTKYYFFVANLLAMDIVNIIAESTLQYVIMILYLFGLNCDSTSVLLKRFALPLHTVFRLLSILLLIPLAVERVIAVKSLSDCHRYTMTKKTVASILATAWGSAAILAVTIMLVVPVDIVWPLAVINFHITILLFFAFARLTSAIFITAANVYLFYKVTESNRKVREDEFEERERFMKLVQLFHLQSKTTITLLMAGGIGVIANTVIQAMHVVIGMPTDTITNLYLQQFLLYPIESIILLSHSLTYGMYMKKIRRRLPRFKNCGLVATVQ